MSFATKLLALRTQQKYSQEALAEKLNVSRQAISKWELGTTLPETEKVIALSEFFGVSIDYLLKDNVKLNQAESMDRVVIKFLSSAKQMNNISQELIDIMEDGVTDDQEKIQMDSIIRTLDSIAGIINEIKQKMNLENIE